MHELLPQVIFYIFAGLTILSAFFVITQNNPVRCVLFLVLAFLTSSVLWMLVHAEFLALILVLVYVGAVMTLFLFVVMMLNIDVESAGSHSVRHLPIGVFIVSLLVALLLISTNSITIKTGSDLLSELESPITSDFSQDVTEVVAKPMSNTEALGMVLYTDYVYAFELAAVILLVAIVAAITLVHQRPHRSKQQSVVKQIMTRRQDRVTLVKMKSEKK